MDARTAILSTLGETLSIDASTRVGYPEVDLKKNVHVETN